MTTAHRTRGLLAALVVTGLLALPATAHADDAAPPASASAPARTGTEPGTDARARYTPPLGAAFSNPLNGKGRVILNQVIRAIYASPKGSTIRLAVWNFADTPTANALIDAKERGVRVQVVVAESVVGRPWARLREALNRNPDDSSFAMRCHNACRSDRFVMHSKFFLFSKAGTRRYVSMFGSSNLTAAAGNRQWNDQTTVADQGVYDYFVQTFQEYAADRNVATPFDQYESDRYRVFLFPRPRDNPIADALAKVRCRDPEAGADGRRTVLRIAVAGWFDEFGLDIARQVRRLWDTGCDIRIVTTLAGRKINRVLGQRYGRGRVPIRQVTIDKDRDGLPERYMHMKSVAVDGYYDGTPNTHVLFTGSPNWSGEARSSDEIWVEVRRARRLVRHYRQFTDQMFTSPAAHGRIQQMQRPSPLRTSADPGYELS